MWQRLERREIRHHSPRPAGARPRPDLPPGTDLLPQIKHIVVLMMENHSYDNYLGMLTGRGDGLPSVPGTHHLTSTTGQAGNPTQTWRASHLQYGDGFPASAKLTVPGGDPAPSMGYWTEEDLPFYYGLARTFPLADRWFCSCLGPTFPNRRFLLSGTAHGLIDDLLWDVIDYPPGGTIFDALTSNGISWVNYHNVNPVRVLLRRLLGGTGLIAARRLAQVGRWLPPVLNTVRGNKSFTADVYPLGLARAVLHLRTMRRFFADADAGTLPSFSIVDPDFGAFSEENPQDIRKGESFAAEVISRVMHGPAWADTLLIWTYDENGGYYDHVAPPPAVPPDKVRGRSLVAHQSLLRSVLKVLFPGYVRHAEQLVAGPGAYDTYGFRVPAVIVSPFARPDCVLSDIFDHTSVLKLVEEKWNLPALTLRDAAATSPLGALDLAAPPAFLTPPELSPPALAWGTW